MSEQSLTVGRIVHFYTKDTAKHFNGQGEGPYPAIAMQCFGSHSRPCECVNLKVLAWGNVYDEGSVSEYREGDEANPNTHARYWKWPPRV